MDPQNYLIKMIKKADGHAPDDILSTIRTDSSVRFYVDSTDFNSAFLTLCINESNCRVVFQKNDSFDTSSRLAFIDSCPVGRPKSDIFIFANQFGEDELRQYLNRGTSILMWWEEVGSFTSFKIKALANEFPDQLFVIGKGFSNFLVSNMLKAPLTILFQKDDFSTEKIKEFATTSGNRVAVVSTGFTDQELTDFKNAGALILPEVVGA